jgi:hypothetical protein
MQQTICQGPLVSLFQEMQKLYEQELHRLTVQGCPPERLHSEAMQRAKQLHVEMIMYGARPTVY